MRVLFIVAFMIGHIHIGAAAEVATKARVLEVERSRLKEFRGEATTSFIVNISDGAARSLEAQSRTLQSFQLANVDERPVQFRISSRLGSLDVSIDFELTTRVSIKREIKITVVSQMEVRRRDSDVEAVLVFTGEQVRHEITTAEGASIVVTGFVTEREVKRLASIERLRENPILASLLDENRQSREPVLVLTPQVVSAPAIPEVAISVNPPTPAQDKYTVQVGAFQSEANASALLADLEKRHQDVFIQKTSSGRPLYRVRVGRSVSVQEVKQLEKRLRGEGFNTLVAQLSVSLEP